MNGPQANLLPDGRRLHLNHGPIDLIIEAFGEAAEVRAAYEQATARFQTILTELVEELPELRSAASATAARFPGPDGAAHGGGGVPARRRKLHHADGGGRRFGSRRNSCRDARRAETRQGLCQQWRRQRAASRAGQSMRLAIAGTGKGFADRVVIRAEDAVRGVATSGWRGRSAFRLGSPTRSRCWRGRARRRTPPRRSSPMPSTCRASGGHARAGARAGARQRPRRQAGDDGCRGAVGG